MKFIDFFAGIGGFRLGMEMAGHECVGHCEIDKYADKSYRAMHNVKESEWFANDITRVEPEELPESDCYCGGFPCQSFSIAGKRGGFHDTRGTLFFEVMRLAQIRKPQYLFLENVAGLLSHDGGVTFGTIISTMGELGYDAEWQVLNSKDFGVPQNRERVFIIGHLGGTSRRKVFPFRSESGSATENYIKPINDSKKTRELLNYDSANRFYDISGISPCLNTVGGGGHEPKIAVQPNCLNSKVNGKQPPQQARVYGIDGGQTPMIVGLNPRKADGTQTYQQDRIYDSNGIIPAICKGKSDLNIAIPVLTPDRAEKRQNGRRFKTDGEPMFTLTSQDKHGVMVKEATKHNFRIRKLTPKECFRLQGFPDEYFERAESVNSNSHYTNRREIPLQ